MSFGGPTKSCPRCNTLLPAQAPVCGTCGLQFAAPSAPTAGPAPYGGQPTPGGWPQSQPAAQPWPPAGPGAPPQGAPGWPPAGPGYPPPVQPSYAPAAVIAPPKQGISRMLIIIVVVVVLVGGGAAAYFLLHGSGSSNNASSRNGLPSIIPLPNGATFVSTQTATDPKSGTATVWYYTVASPNNPSSVEMFYTSNLPSNGWTHVQSDSGGGEYIVLGCQNGQVVGIVSAPSVPVVDSQGKTTSTITAPSGGSALEIAITSDPNTVKENCS